ncbi:MAG: hypothetical protein IJ512_09205 [Ruminococcus sp.]|nr:hypothetical protein [Ruminococcus sp.]
MERQELEKGSEGKKSGSVFLAVLLAVAAVVLAVCKVMQDRAYDEKWSEYDECGLS